MSKTVTLGGDRLGSGKKMRVELHGFDRSSHDKSYIWRSTMSAGTLVPFMKEVALPGDTWDINLDCDIKTHPTIGPLFGSFKVQLDTFLVPMRLYNSYLHNNKMGIGMQMQKVYLPVIELDAPQQDLTDPTVVDDYNTAQINPSCLLAYLGIRGVGFNDFAPSQTRTFNAVPILAYYEIYKQYYANLMEEVGYIIHNSAGVGGAITDIYLNGAVIAPGTPGYAFEAADELAIQWAGGTKPNREYVQLQINAGNGLVWVDVDDLFQGFIDTTGPNYSTGSFRQIPWGQVHIYDWRVQNSGVGVTPQAYEFPLANIDSAREELLSYSSLVSPFNVSTALTNPPYDAFLGITDTAARLSSQEGLALKTFQSDLLNNWLKTEYIDGPTGINEITAIDTSGGSFQIDAFIVAKKVYDMLNRIAVSGGSYRDWLEAVWTTNPARQIESPMYMGGLIKELVFQEVVSNTATGDQSLGTLAGKGVMGRKHKGGEIIIKVDEPCYIIGLVSLTPRIDYSQGNDFDVYAIQTFADFHNPNMDQLGFQDLITEQMAWWATENIGGDWVQRSAGKQPAWVNYMTSINRTYGNFAVEDNEMFMTLNRRYEIDNVTGRIGDLTTYIDPVKFNFIFADTTVDAQNFWAQIAVNATARRMMSYKVMPTL